MDVPRDAVIGRRDQLGRGEICLRRLREVLPGSYEVVLPSFLDDPHPEREHRHQAHLRALPTRLDLEGSLIAASDP
jgi:hypothetical protein